MYDNEPSLNYVVNDMLDGLCDLRVNKKHVIMDISAMEPIIDNGIITMLNVLRTENKRRVDKVICNELRNVITGITMDVLMNTHCTNGGDAVMAVDLINRINAYLEKRCMVCVIDLEVNIVIVTKYIFKFKTLLDEYINEILPMCERISFTKLFHITTLYNCYTMVDFITNRYKDNPPTHSMVLTVYELSRGCE